MINSSETSSPHVHFEISDILFFIKTLRTLPTISTSTLTSHSLSVIATRSCGVKLRHNVSSTKLIKNVISILTESFEFIQLFVE